MIHWLDIKKLIKSDKQKELLQKKFLSTINSFFKEMGGQMRPTFRIIRRKISKDAKIQKATITDEKANKSKQQMYCNFLQRFIGDYVHVVDRLDAFVKSGELFRYREKSYLNKLNVKILKDKLTYLNNDLKSLITKHEFKTVNTMLQIPNNCVTCTLSAILKFDTETLYYHFIKRYDLYDEKKGSSIAICLELIKITGFIDYSTSPRFTNIYGLKKYLKTYARKFENNNLIIRLLKHDKTSLSHTTLIKYKMVHNFPEILIVDYQQAGLLSPDIPCPDRFSSFIDFDQYDYCMIIFVKKLKSNTYFLEFLSNNSLI